MTRVRLILAWILLATALIGWPLSALTVARNEPQFVLGLSFLALAYEAFNAIQIATDKHKEDQWTSAQTSAQT